LHANDAHVSSGPQRRRKAEPARAAAAARRLSRPVGRGDGLRIAAARAALGDRLVILGHHYQRDEVIRFADYTGDSWKLSREIAKHPSADFIVFCGVHFMAESADILALPHQQVILPDLAAGCSMADMVAPDQLETCWSELEQMGVAPAIVPVTYINSAAAIKSFVGERGGTICTSSNAAATLRWSWDRKEKILFLPDQHLGRNTAFKMGVPLDEMVVWDPIRAVRRADQSTARARAPDSVEGPLLRARAFHRQADRGRPPAASRRARHRAS
jgi:quinolinate synthase